MRRLFSKPAPISPSSTVIASHPAISAVRLLQPRRMGTSVIVEIDGKEYELSAAEVSLIAQSWVSAMAGAYVYEMTRLRDED